MNTLRDQMLIALQLSGAKPNTQKSYLREVDNRVKYFNRSPEELGEAELKEYLLYLINLKRVQMSVPAPMYGVCITRRWVQQAQQLKSR